MKVHQIYTDSPLRNFSYIIEGAQGHCFVVDPFDGQACLDYVVQIGGMVRGVFNTHEHYDHVQGNAIIAKKTACAFYAHPNAKGKVKEANCFLGDGERVHVDDDSYVMVLDTPGHTLAHLCFVLIENEVPKAIFTGDTLFNAGIGNCKLGGDINIYYETMRAKFETLDDDLIVYPGHEYLENNLNFSLSVEPNNEKSQELLHQCQKIDWLKENFQTTMKVEREINPFLRLENKQIRNSISLENSQNKDVFVRLRELRDSW